MRTIFLIAFLTLTASWMLPIHAQTAAPQEAGYSESVDATTLERICEAVASECGMCIHDVRQSYASGQMSITKEGDAYRVTLADGGGGTTILIEDWI